MFLFHLSVLNMNFSKLICQTWAFIIKKMHEMHCFHFFVKILADVYSSLRFTDAWKMFFTHTTRDFNDRKLLFLLQMTKHGPTESNISLFPMFCSIFLVLNMAVSKSICQIWPFIIKKTKNVSFSCKCLQFLQEKHVLWVLWVWVSVHILWTLCCIPMDSIDSFKFRMRIILVSYFGGLCFNRPFIFPSFRTGDGDILAQVSQDGDRRQVVTGDRRNFKCWNLDYSRL